MEDTVLCTDELTEIHFAIEKASQLAKQLDRVIYIYSDGIFFWATANELTVYNKGEVGRCYPGGRNEWRRIE